MPDNITFMTIDTDWRVPGQNIEIDPTGAVRGLPTMVRRMLVIGQRLNTGSAAANVLKRVTRPADGVDYFGRGSMLAQMIPAIFKVHPNVNLYAIALDDLGGGTAAAGSYVFGGTATESGTQVLYVGGMRIPFGITSGQNATAIGAAAAAAINAKLDCAATAVNTTGTVAVTARHKGVEGNGINLTANYYDGETTPKGVTVTVNQMTGGTGNPDILTAIASMSTGSFYSIASAYTDTANVVAMESELTSRWGGMDMRTGHMFAFKPGTFSALSSYGSARNSVQDSVFGLKNSPTLPWVVAAQAAAAAERSGANDPALPMRGIRLPDVMAPPEADRFSDSERNLLLHDGISTIIFDESGQAMLEQVITTYQTDTFGLEDVSLLKLNTKWSVDYARVAYRAGVARDYPAHKLAGDEVLGQIQPDQKVATPKLIDNTLRAVGKQLVQAGIIERHAARVVRSIADTNRINAVIEPDIMNQFDVFAAAVKFIL